MTRTPSFDEKHRLPEFRQYLIDNGYTEGTANGYCYWVERYLSYEPFHPRNWNPGQTPLPFIPYGRHTIEWLLKNNLTSTARTALNRYAEFMDDPPIPTHREQLHILFRDGPIDPMMLDLERPRVHDSVLKFLRRHNLRIPHTIPGHPELDPFALTNHPLDNTL